MDIIDKIRQIVEPSLEAMGYTIVLLKLSDGVRRNALTIMAERKDDVPMGFDDCTEISQAVSALLDVDDPIPTAYDLEVSSPGLDRPLTRREDYTRYAGQEAKLETLLPVNGRKRFRGVIKGIEKDIITLLLADSENGEAQIPYNTIRTAKLAVPEPFGAKKNAK